MLEIHVDFFFGHGSLCCEVLGTMTLPGNAKDMQIFSNLLPLEIF